MEPCTKEEKMVRELTFDLQRETKRTYVFVERGPPEEATIIGKLYVKKSPQDKRPPHSMSVRLEWDD